MDFNLFLVEILEKFVAGIPELIILATIVMGKLENVKKTTEDFPNQVEDAKATMKDTFDLSAGEMKGAFNGMSTEMLNLFRKHSKEMLGQVTQVMEGMQSELKDYRDALNNTKAQFNLLVRENKAFVEVISLLVAKDPKMIKDGLATVISRELNMTKKELEEFPEQLMTNLPLLKEVLQEMVDGAGEETLAAIMEEIGYEKKKEL